MDFCTSSSQNKMSNIAGEEGPYDQPNTRVKTSEHTNAKKGTSECYNCNGNAIAVVVPLLI